MTGVSVCGLRSASAVSGLGPDGGPLSCLVPQPSHPKVPATHSACRKAGPASCAEGASRWGFPGTSPGGPARHSGPLHGPQPPPAFLSRVHPSDALGHTWEDANRPALQPPTLILDYDLTLVSPAPCESSPPEPDPDKQGSVACLQFPSWWGPTMRPWRAAH